MSTALECSRDDFRCYGECGARYKTKKKQLKATIELIGACMILHNMAIADPISNDWILEPEPGFGEETDRCADIWWLDRQGETEVLERLGILQAVLAWHDAYWCTSKSCWGREKADDFFGGNPVFVKLFAGKYQLHDGIALRCLELNSFQS